MKERPWHKHYDPGVPVSIDYPETPLFAFLEDAARRAPDSPCTVFRDQAVTYGEMNALASRLAAGLAASGLKKGGRVGLFLPNLPQFVLAFYAVLKAGGVAAAMNPSYTQRELEFQAADAGVETLIGLSSAAQMLESVRERLGLRELILTDLEDAFALPRWAREPRSTPAQKAGTRWLREVVLSQPEGAAAEVQVGASDTAILQYSGGTTGTPKGAIGLHRGLVANSLMFRRWLTGLEDGKESTLMAIPMYHVYGMVVGMSVSVLMGAKMVLIPDPRNLENLLRNIEVYQTSFFPGVPTMYALINRFLDAQAGKYDLRAVRACISGSAPLPKEVKERFESLTGAQLMEGYGLSEAPTATHCNPMFGEKRTGSIGLPLPDVDCRIVSLEDGETDLPPGEAGELLIRGPQVMQGYHNQPEETEEALRGGWLHTGDIARMDSDGYFYIVDRKKDMIKVSGFAVWPREVEQIIAGHPKVLEASVAGVPDPIRGEAPAAWVVLRPGESMEQQEIIDWCKESLVYYKIPVQVEFVESLPRTLVGKVLRRELVRRYVERGAK